MQSNPRNLKVPIIVALIVLVIIGTIYFIASSVSRPGGLSATPTPSASSDGPEYVGVDLLLDRGLKAAQEDGLKFAFYKYFKASGKTITKITFTNVTHNHVNADPPVDELTYDVELSDGSKYKGKADISDLTTGRYYLLDPTTKAVVNDSGVINTED